MLYIWSSCNYDMLRRHCWRNLSYGEVNSVKKHNYKIWLNDGVY